jgi:DNA-binding IclR family transcriptional regulator
LIPDYSIGITAIGAEVGKPASSLSGPIKELSRKGFVVKEPDKRYRIEYSRLPEAIDYCLKSKSP